MRIDVKISFFFLTCLVSFTLNIPVESVDMSKISPTLVYEEFSIDEVYVKLQKTTNKVISMKKPCGERDSIPVHVERVLENDTLVTDQGTFHLGQYYVKIENDSDRYTYRGCICQIKTCISKCCPLGYAYNVENATCNKINILNDPMYDFSFEFFRLTEPYENAVDYIFVTGNPCKHGKYVLEPESYPEDTNYLQPNGNIWKIDKEDYKMFNYSEYCVEKFFGNDSVNTMICFSPPNEETEFSYVAYPIGMLISVPFLIATFIVYAIVPELRNLHGKSLMCHVMSLAVGYTFLAIVQINTHILPSYCVFFGFVIFFSFLVCFFWLNVMCFDIWWTFSGFRGFGGSKRAAEKKKFIVYSIYAWGSPILIIIITLCLQFHPNVPNSWLKPQIGINKCFLQDEVLLPYFYGPMLVLILCNVGLFIATAFKIFRIQKDTAVLKRDDSRRHDSYENDRQRFNLYFKLFVVMGINWTLELISYFSGGPKWLWYITDMGNTLQGALIFIIFVCKRNIWKLLVKRYHSLMGRSHLAHSSMAPTGYSTQQSSLGSQSKDTSNGNKFMLTENSH